MNKDLSKALEAEDDLGVVIRTHIVVEKHLNQFIESKMVNVSHYRKMDIDYFQTVQLAIAMGLTKRFVPFLNSLGTLRNGFAHNMRPDINKQDANNLYKTMDEEDRKVFQKCLISTKKKLIDDDVPTFNQLKPKDKYVLCVVVLCGALEVACEVVQQRTS